jgi:hypothetical protein
MEPTLSSETSDFIFQAQGKFPKEHRQHCVCSREIEQISSTQSEASSDQASFIIPGIGRDA